MIIARDVERIARQFGVDAKLIQAVLNAEGDILKAVRCSIPTVKDREQAIEITCRSCVHAMSEFLKQQDAPGFIASWSERWAPLGAQNDPTGLNRNWPINVLKGWFDVRP